MTRHVLPFGFMKPTKEVTVSTNQNDLNLRTFANGQGYDGTTNCQIIINSGVSVGQLIGTAALIPGSWPTGCIVSLVILGTVAGMGGNGGWAGFGGNGDPSNPLYHGGFPGSAGGTALDATAVSGFTLIIDNSAGQISGGGGGGGGGATNYIGLWSNAGGCCTIPVWVELYGGGGGGGGGAGSSSSAGLGTASNGPIPAFCSCFQPAANGFNGTGGSLSVPGFGGPAGYTGYIYGFQPGGSGGNGGLVGQAGSAGATVGSYAGGLGGAAGFSVKGFANIRWAALGTITGPTS